MGSTHRVLCLLVALLMAGCPSPSSPGSGDSGLQCAQGQTLCNPTGPLPYCASTSTDNANCGTCGTTCISGQVCSAARCGLTCQQGLLNCSGQCVDPKTDRGHCGASGDCSAGHAGVSCTQGQLCVAGTCTTSCPPAQTLCGAVCVDPQTDRGHCGAWADCVGSNAGAACAPGEVCVAGNCTTSCLLKEVRCDGKCVDPQTDRDFCGAAGDCTHANAGLACGSGEVCVAGRCAWNCPPKQVTCRGKCVDPQTDRGFCGASADCTGRSAGVACGAGEVCTLGACVLSCPSGETACKGACVDLQSDNENCNGCGRSCGDGLTCVAGQCRSDCERSLQLGGPPKFSLQDGAYTYSLATGDFDGDGKLDLAIAGSGPGEISVLLGAGNGAFRVRTPAIKVGNGEISIVAGDFDSDGRPDVAYIELGAFVPSQVCVLHGRGDGTFLAPACYPLGLYSGSIVAGDFNGDGLVDIATPGGNKTLNVLLGTAAGGFDLHVLDVPEDFFDLRTGDFDKDGKLDLVASFSHGVVVLMGAGDGTFAAKAPVSLYYHSSALAVGDFNGDGKLDVVTDGNPNEVTMFPGAGDGTFGAPTTFELAGGSSVTLSAAGDVDGDGVDDLAIVSDHELLLLHGARAGVFPARVSVLAAFADSGDIVPVGGDFNGDGLFDIAAAEGGNLAASMFLGASAATPPSRAVYDFVEWSGASALVDLDGDGELDLLVASKTSDNVSVWMGTGNGGFGLPKFYLVSSSPQSITTGDFNGDGKLDVVTSNGSELSILMGVGDGTFADQVTLPAGGPVAAGDFNGDGKLDLAILNRAGAIVSVYLNDGAGTFTASVGQSTADIAGDEPSIAAGDVDGDGKLDVVVANNGASSVTVLLGHGDGTLEGPATFPVGMNPLLMRLVDLDGDGNLDIVTASSTDLSLSVLLGRGDGTFAAPIRYPLQAPPGWLETADLNGDGVPDLLEVGPLGSNGDGTDDLNVLLGLGHGLFATPLVFDAGPYPQSLAVGDLDHDGRLDVVAACIRDVSVLFNQGKWLCGPSR